MVLLVKEGVGHGFDKHLRHEKGFYQKIASTTRLRPSSCQHVHMAGEENDGSGSIERAFEDFGASGVAIHIRHIHIENDHIEQFPC